MIQTLSSHGCRGATTQASGCVVPYDLFEIINEEMPGRQPAPNMSH